MFHWMKLQFWQPIIQQSISWLVTTVPAILVILVLAAIALKLIGFTVKRLRDIMLKYHIKNHGHDIETQKRIDTLVGIVRTTLSVVVWSMLAMVLLRRLGVDIAPLLAGAGIAGLALGFGAQELVRDVISGFFILLENQVRTGDVAIINGTGGFVENIGLRTITVRDLSGVVHVFQNGKINTLANMTKEWSAMVFDIPVAYKEDTDRIITIMKDVADDLQSDLSYKDKILKPIEIFGVESFEESAVVIKARYQTKPMEQWSIGREYRRRLKKAFDKEGVEIPFPHRTILLDEKNPALQILTTKNNLSTGTTATNQETVSKNS